MRKISSTQVTWMMLELFTIIGFSVLAGWFVFVRFDGAGWGGFLIVSTAVWVVLGTLSYRLTMALFPLMVGNIPPGSRQEFIYNVFHLPYLFFLFYPMAWSGLIPTPLTRLFYRCWGARIGPDTYPGRCMIFDPRFVSLGERVSLGFQASLIPHVIDGTRLAHHSIHIEDGVTIGANAIIMAGVTIQKDSIVAAGSVMTKFTRVGPGEIWAGVPARRIGSVPFPQEPSESSLLTPPEKGHLSHEDTVSRNEDGR